MAKIQDGIIKIYNENGKLGMVAYYKNNKLEGVRKCYDPYGNLYYCWHWKQLYNQNL